MKLEVVLLVLGGLLMAGALVAGLVRRSFLSLAALFAPTCARASRTAAVWIALAGTGVDTATKAFMAWFGLKGVATMTFSLFVLGEGTPGGERIFNLAALCVFASVLVHGLSDTPGSEWLIRRSDQASAAEVRGPIRAPRGGRLSPSTA